MPIELLEDRIAPTVFIVANLHDSGTGSLRAAIAAANNSPTGLGNPTNTIEFAPSVHPGTILLKTPLPPISVSVDIAGPKFRYPLITINGGNKNQIFYVSYNSAVGPSPTVTITGFKLVDSVGMNDGSMPAGAVGGGALFINDLGGTVTMGSCVLSHNIAAGAAGDSADNGAMGQGGAIDLQAGALMMINCVISGNTAKGGSAPTGYVGGQAQGGGIYVGQYGALTLQNSTVTHNKALGGFGLAGAKGAAGIKGAGGADGSDGLNGATGGYGGGAYGGGIFSLGSVTVQVSTISGNKAIGGNGGNGGAGGTGGAAAGHAAGGEGGNGGNGNTPGAGTGGGIQSGLFGQSVVNTPTLNLANSTISGNVAASGLPGLAGAAGKGGAGAPHGGAGQKGVSAAPANALGGGVYTYSSYLATSQITVAGNSAAKGGGLYLSANLKTDIDNSTIAFNKASTQAGGLFAVPDLNDDLINLTSTILSQNKSISDSDVAGNITADHSLIANAGDAVITASMDIIGRSALLGALGNHGGSTETCLPGAGSPAIRAGIIAPDGPTLVTDQRGNGFSRTIDGFVDIGAVEVG
jgi:hypothetical protein